MKLHGSANRFDDDGRRIMILGGAKQQEIGHIPMLKWYLQLQEECLLRPGTRLMVIGYGFRDDHVSAAVDKAASLRLKLFVIDLLGARIAYEINESRKRHQIGSRDTPLEQLLQRSLIGGSRRPLRDIFGADVTEHNKVTRFFDRL